MPSPWFHRLLVVAMLLLPAAASDAFSLYPDLAWASARDALEEAARWSAEPDPFGYGTGLHDGIQVAVSPDFAGNLGVTDPLERQMLEEAIRSAFRAWENGALRFEVTINGPAQEGTLPGEGLEIDLFAAPGSHPVFSGFTERVFGVAVVDFDWAGDRLLSNGDRTDLGLIITRADIFIHIDDVTYFRDYLGLSLEAQARAIQRLMMHEIGHTLGLGHCDDLGFANFDTDSDPLNPMPIDPADPFAGIETWESRDPAAIMTTGFYPLEKLFYDQLQNDDRGGRDVLYPVPEPSLGGLGTSALLALWTIARIRARRGCRQVPDIGGRVPPTGSS